MDYVYNRITNSKAYSDCESLIQSLQNTKITQKERNEIIDKYVKLIVDELHYKQYEPKIRFSYIPYLFRKYNIETIKDIEPTIYDDDKPKSKKTAPTLCDGWAWYTIAMLVVSIFYERVIAWIIITIIFIVWRANEIDKYN